MNNLPLVSIITPYYNSDKYIAETINSVINQTYQNWEHIIVDDGSTQESFSYLKKLALKNNKIKIYRRDRAPKGRSTSRNIGIEKSSGKYLLFLDSDDLLFPHCIEKRVKIMEQDKFDFAVFQMEMFLPNGKVKEILSTLDVPNYLQSFLSFNHPWNITCPIWNSSFFKNNIKGFVESLPLLEDPEIHTRALMIDSISYEVFSNREFIDSSYRVDYKPTNLAPLLDAVIYYVTYFYKKVTQRNDIQESLLSLATYYESILSHFSGQSKEDIYSNINKMKHINDIFYSYNIIDKKKFTKTKVFLWLVKHKYFESQLFVKLLNTFGFKNFHYFVFKDFLSKKG